MIVLYIGMVIVIVSVFTIKPAEGNAAGADTSVSPPLSPAMICLLNLLTSFFFVYLGLWIAVLWNQFVSACGRAIKVFDTAKSTVMLNPMLCVLFIGARMRALQITENKGQPQGYAQQSMFLTTWAVELQIALVTVFGLLTHMPLDSDSKASQYGEGLKGGKTRSGSGGLKAGQLPLGYWTSIIATVCEFFRYVNMAAMYAGACIVIYSIYDVTTDNANGKGQLIDGVTIPPPLS